MTYLESSARVQRELLERIDLDELAGMIRDAGTVLLIGNGGGQAEAEHWASHLVDHGILAFAPAASGPTTTMLANDRGFDVVYESISRLLRPEDLLIGFTAGGSADVLKALHATTARRVIFTGAFVPDLSFPAHLYARWVEDPRLIEDAWQVVGHALLDVLK